MFDPRLLMEAGRSLFRAWFDGGAAVTTILLRAPIVMADPLGREAQRMVFEKAAAAGEAALAAGMASARAALSPPRTPAGAARTALRIAEKAARPARKRVRANTRRLTRAKRR